MFAGIRAALLAVLLVSLICLPLIVMGNMRGRGAGDQLKYHEIAIHTFAEQWPRLDFKRYASATTPGYHVLLAGAEKLGLGSRMALRLASFGFTAAMVGLLAWWCARRRPRLVDHVLLWVPLCVSLYVINSGAWLLPDNLGWLGVMGILMLCVRHHFGVMALAGASLMLVGLVFVRQIHIWAAAPIWVAAWLGASTPPEDSSPVPPFNDLKRRVPGVVIAMVLSLPAFWLLYSFYRLWGGHLTPPDFVILHNSSVNFSSMIMTLSLFGIVGAAYWADTWGGLLSIWRRSRVAVMLVVLLALGLSLAPPSSYAPGDAGRWSGIWDLARWSVWDRSPILAVLSFAGVLAIFAWCVRVPARERWVLLSAVVAFCASQMVNAMAWQRYHEPFVLIIAALFGASIRRERLEEDATPPLLRAMGPLVLCAMLLGVTALKLVTEKPAVMKEGSETPSFDSAPAADPVPEAPVSGTERP